MCYTFPKYPNEGRVVVLTLSSFGTEFNSQVVPFIRSDIIATLPGLTYATILPFGGIFRAFVE